VVDAADPAFRDQYEVTQKVLQDIGAQDNDTLLVLNKSDRLDDEAREQLRTEFPDAFMMSARDKSDIERLHALLVAHFERDMQEHEFLIPYSQQRSVGLLHERCRVLAESYEAEGARIKVRAAPAMLRSIERELGALPPPTE
jgi:GTP-binding protein HflX